jgi:hypothetical protein
MSVICPVKATDRKLLLLLGVDGKLDAASQIDAPGVYTQNPNRSASPIFGNGTVITRTLLDSPAESTIPCFREAPPLLV